MVKSEQIAFLQASIERWRQQGLLDDVTFERLRADIERDLPAPPPELAASAGAMPDAAVAARVAFHPGHAAEVPAAQPADAATHAAHEAHAAYEAHAATAAHVAVPVAERPAQLGQAVAAAATDLVTFLPDDANGAPAGLAGHARLSPESRLIAHQAAAPGPAWMDALRQFLVANAMWLAGALLIIAGSIYFLRLAWDHLSSVPLHVVIAGALHGYAAAFFGVGYLLARKRDAHAVGRILFAFACGIFLSLTLLLGILLDMLPGIGAVWS